MSSSTLQKNIPPQGRNGLYYDSDIFFTLGDKTGDRPKKLGGRFDKIVPVGSLFFESEWHKTDNANFILKKDWDILYVGINHRGAEFQDIYADYQDDYYEHFVWLANLSREHPTLRIGISHHTSNIRDVTEMELIRGTNIERLDSTLSSYRLAFQSRLIVTFGSTMGFEMLGCNVPTIFLDPGGRNWQFLPDTEEPDIIRIESFEELLAFWSMFESLEINSMKMLTPTFTPEDWCKKSDGVSASIFATLMNSRTNSEKS
jgi:hypothetical protein